ncbi:MAG: hypothetical protein KKG47_04565 [Proteobacteria bacterium]|nr:hypothetical protein [Pseudomonadota bacterium]MBU1738807.1 hypothetical protein [Pseudomonadota bacterium]
MAQAEHGLEPATVVGLGPDMTGLPKKETTSASYLLTRRANRDEISKFERLVEREEEAFAICKTHIEKHRLNMKLIRVERYFNGSKIIFYFTAENRVDFRELVKDLVQEFRTRVEIRQIGVRHETKMVGGLGCCGRELCCSSFIKNFSPVSIKMAKTQNLPLNPAKISGVCNRLLCCLTYEYDTYRKLRKGMPKVGKNIVLDDKEYKVINSDVLAETVTVVIPGQPDPPRVVTRREWAASDPRPQDSAPKGDHKEREQPPSQQPRKKGRPGKGQWQKGKKKEQQ